MVVTLGLPLLHRHALFNCACLAVDGRIAGFVGKRFLCGDGLHYEPRWFKPWPAGIRDAVRIGESEYPIGDLIFDCGGIRSASRFAKTPGWPRGPAAACRPMPPDLILNPSASHFAFGKDEVRRRLVLESSRAFHVGYIYANLLGNEAGRVIYDGGALIAAEGKLLAAGPRFTYRPLARHQRDRRPAGQPVPAPPARSAISPSWALAIRGWWPARWSGRTSSPSRPGPTRPAGSPGRT